MAQHSYLLVSFRSATLVLLPLTLAPCTPFTDLAGLGFMAWWDLPSSTLKGTELLFGREGPVVDKEARKR